MKLTSVVPAVAAVVILLPIGFSLVWAVASPGAQIEQPFLQMPEGEEECVEDVAYMRFQHMDLLLEIRDGVVREGTKGQIVRNGTERTITLDGCWECHTDRETFCNKCHDSVNLSLNCFRCHHDPSSELQLSDVTASLANRHGEEDG